MTRAERIKSRIVGRTGHGATRAALASVCMALIALFGTPASAQRSGDIDFPPVNAPRPITKPVPSFGQPSAPRQRGKVVVVDGTGSGNASIQAAVNAAGPGGVVRVKPAGRPYGDSLVLSFPVTIESATPGQMVDIRAPYDRPCVYAAPSGNGLVRLSGLRFLKPNDELGYRAQPCVIVEAGYFSMTQSSVEATIHNPAVLLRGGFSRIESTVIRNGQVGVQIDAAPDGDYFLIGNDIVGNVDGIRVNGRAPVTALENHIRDNIQNGVVSIGGGGIFTGNWIYGNGESGVLLQRSDLAPRFIANFIARNQGAGVRMWPDARATIGWNQVCNNAGPALQGRDANPFVVLDPPNESFGNSGGDGGGLFRSRRDGDNGCTQPPSPGLAR